MFKCVGVPSRVGSRMLACLHSLLQLCVSVCGLLLSLTKRCLYTQMFIKNKYTMYIGYFESKSFRNMNQNTSNSYVLLVRDTEAPEMESPARVTACSGLSCCQCHDKLEQITEPNKKRHRIARAGRTRRNMFQIDCKFKLQV